jgi:hypothetical protein
MQILSGSIDLSKIDKKRVKEVALKSGGVGKFLDVQVIINDEPDAYNQIASMVVGQTKEEREQKVAKTYLGNLKEVYSKPPASGSQVPLSKTTEATPDDDLPF